MAEQPFLIGDGPWIPVKDGNLTGMSLFMRHYSARHRRKIHQFVGPGGKMVLLTPDARALFVWRKFRNRDKQDGVNCAVFRNEESRWGRSSDLILSAMQEAWSRWPGERLYTYVDPAKVRSTNPGCCFKKAEWRYAGQTRLGLLVFEVLGVKAGPQPAICRACG